MIPITRKEQYINEIVGNGDTAPEKPVTREEIFFSSILGEAVPPEPISKTEIYLSKISGADIEIPEPISRHEIFLARAAGMDITTPVPITKEEMLWSNYTGTVEFTLEGIPPLTYKAIEGMLKNYRIYGNTINGENVGDRTGNLWDEIYEEDGKLHYVPIAVGDGFFTLSTTTPNGGESASSPGANIFLLAGNVGSGASSANNGVWRENSRTIEAVDGYVTIAYRAIQLYGEQCYPWNNDTMLNAGSTPLPYEPYGYRVPVTINDVTTNLYLPEPLKMVGDEAEYVDFVEQKQYFADGTSVDVELPALPTTAGINVLSVGTEVQPSKVYVKGEKQQD